MTAPNPDVSNTEFSTEIKDVPSWRDVLSIHPAAELFPHMSPDELRALGEDIVKNKLMSPVALWRSHPKAPVQLLDGISRLDAIQMVAGPVTVGAPSIMAGKDFLARDKVIELDQTIDPYGHREQQQGLAERDGESADRSGDRRQRPEPLSGGTQQRELPPRR
jgi:hypothetical protein